VSATDNILRVFRQADQIDLDEGLAAYFNYRRTMELLGARYGYTLDQVTAAFSALSPNNDYLGNLRSLVTVMDGHTRGLSAEEFNVSSYRACARRALLYLGGTPFLEHAGGPKTRSFYINIRTPWLPRYVTIDGHMVSVWHGQRYTMKAAVQTKFNYERLADDFRLVAHRLGVLPNQVQAVCWFVWKRINNIVFESQLSLLQEGDQWGLILAPEEIKPFANRRQESDERTSNRDHGRDHGRLGPSAGLPFSEL
jgi:hypothetical protein